MKGKYDNNDLRGLGSFNKETEIIKKKKRARWKFRLYQEIKVYNIRYYKAIVITLYCVSNVHRCTTYETKSRKDSGGKTHVEE